MEIKIDKKFFIKLGCITLFGIVCFCGTAGSASLFVPVGFCVCICAPDGFVFSSLFINLSP